MAEEPDRRRMTLERDIVAWEKRALKAERQRDQARQEVERLEAERREAIRIVGHRLWSHPLITTMDESHRNRVSTVLDSLLETGARPSWEPFGEQGEEK